MNTPILKTDIDVMLDIESLGTTEGSVILSIAAVPFGLTPAHFSETFYEKISLDESLKAGFTTDKDTFEFWNQQHPEVRGEAFSGVLPPAIILADFATYLEDLKLHTGLLPILWGNGVRFDNALIEAAYTKLEMEVPWGFRQERCFRTLKKLTNVSEPEFIGVKHHALHDAMHQAKWAEAILEYINGNKTESSLTDSEIIQLYSAGGIQQSLNDLEHSPFPRNDTLIKIYRTFELGRSKRGM